MEQREQWPGFATAILGIVLVVLIFQSVSGHDVPQPNLANPDAPCVGQPIVVNYPFPHPEDADFENPWECQVQCADKVQRYILYSNGRATQCSKVPGCLDQGEDNWATCTPPQQSVMK